MEGATMKSFQVRTSFVDALAASAVPESMARQFRGVADELIHDLGVADVSDGYS
jgi:hypothetical protein